MKKLIIILISIFFCVTSLSYAQNINWNLTGAGARAAGFGGAFIGVADDATAISWNPAGLTQLIDPEASAVMNGRLISVVMAEESSHLAFSAPSFRRCSAMGSLRRSMP